MSTSPETGAGRDAPVSVFPLTRRHWIGSLPSPLTPLIGRDKDRVNARVQIERAARLLTLAGPGGIGKSRLAVQLAVDLEGNFPDGVARVPLVAVRDVDEVMPALPRLWVSARRLASRHSRS